MSNYQYSELYHHGVKGQKWGVRRYQNADGTLTQEGRNKYLSIVGQNNKSKVNDKQAAEYLEKRRKRIRAGIAIGLGIGLAATGAVLYSKYGSDYIDKTIRKGGTINNLSFDNYRVDNFLKGNSWQLYGSINNNDHKNYRAFFGGDPGNTKYKSVLKATGKIKIASRKSGRKAFDELIKNDPDFKKNVNSYLSWTNFNVSSKKGGLTDYKKFNIGLHRSNHAGLNEAKRKYYDYLKSKGYSGVIDENDVKSGFAKEALKNNLWNAKAPTVFFDNSKLKDVTNKTERVYYTYNPFTHFQIKNTWYEKDKLSDDAMNKAKKYIIRKDMAYRVAPIAAASAGTTYAGGLSAYIKKKDKQEAAKYKKKKK